MLNNLCDTSVKPTTMSKFKVDSEDSESSEDSEGDIDSLMYLLDDKPDIWDFEIRKNLPVGAALVNFNKCTSGHCNYRDGVVLNNHPGIVVPSHFNHCDKILISFFLNHPLTVRDNKSYLEKYKTPNFVNKQNKDIDARERFQHPILANEQWSSSQNKQIHWKKRGWGLSRDMRDIAGVKHPEYVIVVTPRENGILNYSKSVRTASFRILSKEQPKASAFTSGSIPCAKRRTPETYHAEQILKAEQTDILRLNDANELLKTHMGEYKTRLDFALAIIKSDPSAQHLENTILQHINSHKCKE